MLEQSKSRSERYRIGDLVFDIGRRHLSRGSKPICLSKLAFQLLRVLVQRAPDLVPHDVLVHEVWGPHRIVSPENIAQRVMKLRRSLNDSAAKPRYIEGVRGHGYRLIPEAVRISDPILKSDSDGEDVGRSKDHLSEWGSASVGADSRPGTPSAEAHALYQQALGLRVIHNAGERMRIILERAISLDPNFAEAHGQLAYLHAAALLHTVYCDAADAWRRSELEQLIRRYAMHALTLKPDLSIAVKALAAIEVLCWRWHDASQLLVRAREPDCDTDQLPWIHAWLGEHNDAIRNAALAVELNGRDWATHRDLGVCFAYVHDFDRALTCLETSVALAPSAAVSLAWLAYVHVARGAQDEALDLLQLIEHLISEQGAAVFLPELAYAYGRIGRLADARRLVGQIREIAAHKTIGAGTWAMAYLAIEDRESALAWLRKAATLAQRHELDSGMINLMNLKLNFTDDPTLKTAAFSSALSKISGH